MLETLAVARKMADVLSVKIDRSLASGSHGEAFSTVCGNVIKITNDASEAINSERLIGTDNNHLIKVHSVDVIDDSTFCIFQDLLDTTEASRLYMLLIDYAENVEFTDLETLLACRSAEQIKVTPSAVRLFRDLKKSESELVRAGICFTDQNEENIGSDQLGNFVVFDLSNEEMSTEDRAVGIRDLKAKKQCEAA